MSFYDDASLIMYPSGYKEDKIYSLKPTDGSGDLTFTRASTATRVNAEGLIEQVPYNLVQYSEDMGAQSSNSNISVNTSATTSPTGTSNGNKVSETAVNNFHSVRTDKATPNGYDIISIYAKAAERTFIQIQSWANPGDYVNFDLTNGDVSYASTSNIYGIESVGNGWYRCYANVQASGGGLVGVGIITSGTAGWAETYAGDAAKGVYMWGLQINSGATAKPYFPTTDRLNVPRIDYTGGGCGKLLLEPQRTNLVTYSEQFDNAAWIGDRKTITANAIISPDGTQNADLLTATATLGTHNINPSTLINLLSSAGTFSVFAKYNGYNLSLSIAGSSTNWTGCVFDLQNGIARTPQSSGAQSPCTAKIEDFGNGWYRCSISYTPYTSGTFYTFIGATSTNNSTLVSFGLEDFTANGTSGFYLYGAQVEANASYVSSYIPTLASSVTRLADAASKTGIGSLIGTEFTLFYDGYETTGGQSTRYIALKGTGGTYANAVIIEGQATNQIFVTVLNNSSTTVYASSRSGLTNGQRIKLAVRCKNNDFAFYVNGSLATAQASGSVPTTSTLYLGYYIDYDDNYSQVNQAIIFPTGLTNAQLAELTTL